MVQYPVMIYEHMQYSNEIRSNYSIKENNVIFVYTGKSDIILPIWSKCAVKPFLMKSF